MTRSSRSNPRPLAAVVGSLVRRRREAKGLLLDEVAEEMRAHGFPEWVRATVSALELGRRKLDLEELCGVCLALDVELPQLLNGGEEDGTQWVRWGGEVSSWAVLRWLLTGERPSISLPSKIEVRRPTKAAQIVIDARDETLKRVARRLGEDPSRLAETALRLWKASLPRERDRRVAAMIDVGTSPRSRQAIRGHITRELVSELRAAIQEGK